jgi:transcription elongation factor Elf1
MTQALNTEERKQQCPYCGQPIHLIIEVLEESQQYTEDCEVCCQPMVIEVSDQGEVWVAREDAC